MKLTVKHFLSLAALCLVFFCTIIQVSAEKPESAKIGREIVRNKDLSNKEKQLDIPHPSAKGLSKRAIYFDTTDKAICFAAEDLMGEFKAQGVAISGGSLADIDLSKPNTIILAVQSDEIFEQLAAVGGEKVDKLGREEFAIRVIQTADGQVFWVVGGDRIGAMYGGLELAEMIKLHIPIKNSNHSPDVEKRGLKLIFHWMHEHLVMPILVMPLRKTSRQCGIWIIGNNLSMI